MNSILVVNANTNELVTLSSLLSTSGYSVIAKTDGASALSAISEGADIDLVISNFTLPDMNGLNLFGAIKASGSAHPPVILFSDRVDVMTYLTALRHGVFEFLFSPVNYRELLRIVKVATQQSRENSNMTPGKIRREVVDPCFQSDSAARAS